MSSAVIDLDVERKHWTTLVARGCLAGYQLWRTDPADGVQRYFAGKWGMVRVLANAEEVERFLEQAGAR